MSTAVHVHVHAADGTTRPQTGDASSISMLDHVASMCCTVHVIAACGQCAEHPIKSHPPLHILHVCESVPAAPLSRVAQCAEHEY